MLSAVPYGVVCSDRLTGESGTHSFTLPDGDATLDPGTGYACRLMVQDGDAYHTLADAQYFTTDTIPQVSLSASAASYTAEVMAVFGTGEACTGQKKYYGSKEKKFSIKKGTLPWH